MATVTTGVGYGLYTVAKVHNFFPLAKKVFQLKLASLAIRPPFDSSPNSSTARTR